MGLSTRLGQKTSQQLVSYRFVMHEHQGQWQALTNAPMAQPINIPSHVNITLRATSTAHHITPSNRPTVIFLPNRMIRSFVLTLWDTELQRGYRLSTDHNNQLQLISEPSGAKT